MSKRDRLNTDLLINISVSIGISNILALSRTSLRRAERDRCRDLIDEMSESTNNLSERSKQLDEEGL